MKWNKTREENFIIEKGCKESPGRGKFSIRCVRGVIWVTWPGSGDVILYPGEEIFLKTEGILCITAMSSALVNIHTGLLIPPVKEIPGLLIQKSFKAVVSYFKNGGHQSAFGDSIHSITR